MRTIDHQPSGAEKMFGDFVPGLVPSPTTSCSGRVRGGDESAVGQRDAQRGGLLAAARDAGEVITAISLDQILDLIVAIAKIPCDSEHREPILEMALAGLRRSATHRSVKPAK
jgi:hypothetical protein